VGLDFALETVRGGEMERRRTSTVTAMLYRTVLDGWVADDLIHCSMVIRHGRSATSATMS